jgi:hypothetical protein
MMMMVIIQFYLRANLRAQRPITKRARVEKNTKKKKQKQENFNSNDNNNSIKRIIIIIIPVFLFFWVHGNNLESQIHNFRGLIEFGIFRY